MARFPGLRSSFFMGGRGGRRQAKKKKKACKNMFSLVMICASEKGWKRMPGNRGAPSHHSAEGTPAREGGPAARVLSCGECWPGRGRERAFPSEGPKCAKFSLCSLCSDCDTSVTAVTAFPNWRSLLWHGSSQGQLTWFSFPRSQSTTKQQQSLVN